jgi:GNAT superfamily N-acetyltransferase
VSVAIFPLQAVHRSAWQPLAEGYKAFYETPTSMSEYDLAWQKIVQGNEVHGLGASLGTGLVGIAHFFFHASTWAPRVCYLQDLFTAPHARGQGVARALIDAVAQRARDAGAARCYWLTHESNAAARRVYDRVARFGGFIRYDHPLDG